MIDPHLLMSAGVLLAVTVTLLRWTAPTCSDVPWRSIQTGSYVVATLLVVIGVVLLATGQN
jgi:hypothetical protein